MPETLGEDTNPVNQIIEINSNFLENWLTLRKQYAKEILTQGQSHN